MNLRRINLIAEIGVNHNGSITNAKKLILVAKKAGANYVKFQSFVASELVQKKTKLAKYQKNKTKFNYQYELLKKLELSKKKHEIILNFCKKKKINFLSTPFDLQSCQLLKSLKIKIIKISSGDINNYPLLEEVSKFAKKVIISTGMSNLKEIKDAIYVLKKNKLKNKDIIVLHCTSNYPTKPQDVNILAIKFLRKKLNNHIGYSDHSIGVEAALAAATLGARVIEKHITLSNKLSGPDHQSSLEPNKFFQYVKSIKKLEKILGKEKKFLTKSEQSIRKISRRSIVAKTPITKGEIFTINNIICKRPEGGLSPMKWNKIIGKKSKFNFKKNSLIKV